MLVGFPTHDPQPIFELVVRAGRKIRATTEANRCEHQLCAASNETSKDFVAFRASKDKISAVWET